jgi:hypothetical protein
MTGQVFLRSLDWGRTAKCRSCRATIVWAKTQGGAWLAVNPSAKRTARVITGVGIAVSSDHVHKATCRGEHHDGSRTPPSEWID